ncbi:MULTISPECIES: hypothetical protein [unclassified Amycolatopsis]|uniref:hypothetical protein n=1 Tax=unclassified Amycolatopsis TaxID=2618356 RepID=UPI002875EE09|nr:hypothetical protein [Amycolatopsis sp. 505]MDS0149673.1 hypothetical protein [Amycolatopsis sp. CM201R]
MLVEKMSAAGIPSGSDNDSFGISMLGNTMLRWSEPALRTRFLPRIASANTSSRRDSPNRAPASIWPHSPGAPNSCASWSSVYLNARAGTIYAGSSQVQRGIVGDSCRACRRNRNEPDGGSRGADSLDGGVVEVEHVDLSAPAYPFLVGDLQADDRRGRDRAGVLGAILLTIYTPTTSQLTCKFSTAGPEATRGPMG